MKILFIDPIQLVYDTTTPARQPLGGTQSAVVYLTAALARIGHEVAVINARPEPTETDGVRFLSLPMPSTEMNGYDAIVLVSRAMAGIVRGVGCDRPLALWCHHATDQPAVRILADPTESSLYAGFAMVSRWQAEEYRQAFGLATSKMRVLRNAVSPAFFQGSQSDRKWLSGGGPPVLAYTSMPYRGLDLLLLAFSQIRAALEGARLKVFSGMDFYGRDSVDGFASLFALARVLPGVELVGALPHPQLAEAMAEVDIWSYPCTFAETSCISAMEAMAAGTMLVTTSRGALPETTGGFAYAAELGHDQLFPGLKATNFANGLLRVAQGVLAEPVTAAERIALQVEFARRRYNWTDRAHEWVAWLETLL